jgi:hypothetical protein
VLYILFFLCLLQGGKFWVGAKFAPLPKLKARQTAVQAFFPSTGGAAEPDYREFLAYIK